MYTITFNAYACNRRLDDMMVNCDLLNPDEHIGERVKFSFTTTTLPTDEYIHKLKNHIENMPAEVSPKIQYVEVKLYSIN